MTPSAFYRLKKGSLIKREGANTSPRRVLSRSSGYVHVRMIRGGEVRLWSGARRTNTAFVDITYLNEYDARRYRVIRY